METELSWKNTSKFGIGLKILGGIIKANDFWGFTVILLACFHSATFFNSESILSRKFEGLDSVDYQTCIIRK